MLLAAPNIEICAIYVLTGIEAITAPTERLGERAGAEQ